MWVASLSGIWSMSPLAGMTGLLAVLFVSLARGWIIPKSSHEREMGMAKERGDEWKGAAKDQDAVNQEIRLQNTMLIEALGTSKDFFAKVTVDEETGERRVGP